MACLVNLQNDILTASSKKYYSLTNKGKDVLGELILFWSSYEDCVNGFIASYQHAEVLE